MTTMDPPEGTTNQGGQPFPFPGAAAATGLQGLSTALNQPPGLHPGSMMMGMWNGPTGTSVMRALQRRSSGGGGQDGGDGASSQNLNTSYAAAALGGLGVGVGGYPAFAHPSVSHGSSHGDDARRGSLLGAVTGASATEDESLNYLAARAHAAQMLAAEESRRLEENLMRLEMRRMMMGRTGAATGGANNQAQGAQSPGQGQAAGGEHAQSQEGDPSQGQGNEYQPRASLGSLASNETGGSGTNDSSTAHPQGVLSNQDSALMARAQQFSMTPSVLGQYQSLMGRASLGFGVTNQAQALVPYGLGHLAAASQGLLGQGLDQSANNQAANTQASNTQAATTTARPAHDPQPHAQAEAMAQAAEEHQAATSKSKNKKDKSDPRRPLSAYNIFFSEYRDILLKEQEGGDGDAADGGRRTSEADGSVASKDDPKDIQTYAQNLMNKRLNKARPKRAHRKSHGKVAFTSLAKMVGARWRSMPDADKKKYRDLADIDRARYRREKAALGKKVRGDASKKMTAEEAARLMKVQQLQQQQTMQQAG